MRNLGKEKLGNSRRTYNLIKTQNKKIQMELQKSDISDYLSKFQKTQEVYKHKIEQLKNQLLQCINSINQQINRQKTLQSLISIMKETVVNQNNKKTKLIELNEVKIDKMLSKQLYQIDKISQKYNKQLAKIKKLKEIVNSGRSQRVVHSNMFKKLQKQIKQHEQIYKQSLIKRTSSQLQNKQKKKFSLIYDTKKSIRSERQHLIPSKSRELTSNFISQIVKKNYEIQLENSRRSSIFSASMPHNRTQNKKIHYRSNSKFLTPTNQRQEMRKTVFKQQRFTYTKELLNNISHYSMLLASLMTHTQFSNVSQIIDHFSTLQNNNEATLNQINQIQKKIEYFTQQKQKYEEIMKRNSFQLNNLDYSDIDLAELIGYQFNLQISNETHTQKQNHIVIFKDILSLFEIQLTGHESNVEIQQKCQQMEQKTQKLYMIQPIKYESGVKRQNVYNQTLISCLIQRMDKYTNSQKVLSRQSLIQQYHKQLSKCRYKKTKISRP